MPSRVAGLLLQVRGVLDRRAPTLIAATIVLLISAVLVDALWKHNRRAPAAIAVPTPASASSTAVAPPDTAAPPATTPGTTATRALQGPPPPATGPSYMELFARSETRRRIRASAGYTYLNEIVLASQDSMLHRWDNRINRPVRVFLGPGTAANFQPSFLDAVRDAFQRWRDTGLPVRFNLDVDSASAEVHFRWRIQFDMERTGQTDLTWDQDGNLVTAEVTLATFDPKGRPLGPDEMRVVALHEIGHVLGLDHSPDSSDVMYARTKVQELSPRDTHSALLLYQLPPGSLR